MILQLLIAAVVSSHATDTTILPPLHTLKDKDLVSVNPSFQDQTITIALTNGTSYIYDRIDWDYEDHFPSTADRIRNAIRNITMTFTKVEVPPQFPGGDSAWDAYIHAFCQQHRRAIGDGPPVGITVQFIVHMKGQVSDVQVIGNLADVGSDLGRLAVQAIKDAPAWVPAQQNGRTVISYKKQVVKLAR